MLILHVLWDRNGGFCTGEGGAAPWRFRIISIA